MRFLHFSDLHLDTVYPHVHSSGKYSVRTYDALDNLNHIIRNSNKEGTDCVFIAGDIFNRPNVSDSLKREFVSSISNFEFCLVFIITGQHDLRSDQTTSLTLVKEVLGKMTRNSNNFIITDFGYSDYKIESDIILHMVPYGIDYKHHLKIAQKRAKTKYKGLVNILLAHFPVRGSKVNDNYYLEDGVSIKGLSVFDYIAAGDIHLPQSIGNLYYPGNVIKTRFGEKDGTYVMGEIKPNSKSKVSFKTYPIKDRKYWQGSLKEIRNLKKSDILGSVIRLNVKQGYDPNKLKSIVDQLGKFALSVTYKVVGADFKVSEDFSKTNLQVDFWKSVKEYLREEKVGKDIALYVSGVRKRIK